MPAIVALALAAVFAAGNALANAPDAPVREQAETQAVVIVVPNAEKIRPPEVAAKTSTGHRPLPDSHYRWPDSPGELQKPQIQEEWGKEWLQQEEWWGEWKRERALACLRGVSPDADESELESALEDTANCIKCPQVCGRLQSEDFLRRNEFRFREEWPTHEENAPVLRQRNDRRPWEKQPTICSAQPNWSMCWIPNPNFFLTPNGGPNP